MGTVYIEIIFIDNFIVNFIIVFISGRLAGAKRNVYRCAGSAAIGAVYAVMAFALAHALQNFFIKIIISVLMCLTAYGFKNLKAFLKCIFVMYSVTMLFGGMTLAARFFFDVSIVPGGIAFGSGGFRYTLIGVAIALVLGEWIYRTVNDRFESSNVKIEAEICGECIQLNGFVDTGNGLFDPITGEGIVVVSAAALKKKLSKEAAELIFDEELLWNSDSELKPRIVMFETIAGQGSMIAVKPSKMVIEVRDKKYCTGAYMAVTENKLSNEYDAITGTNIKLNEI